MAVVSSLRITSGGLSAFWASMLQRLHSRIVWIKRRTVFSFRLISPMLNGDSAGFIGLGGA